jgi:hypothetical protein
MSNDSQHQRIAEKVMRAWRNMGLLNDGRAETLSRTQGMEMEQSLEKVAAQSALVCQERTRT